MTKVLLLGGGTQGLVIARDLAKSNKTVYMLGEKRNYGGVSRYVQRCFEIKWPVSSPGFLSQVKRILEDYSIDTIVPMGDVMSEFLSKNKGELCTLVKYLMPDYADFIKGVDKNQLMQLCKDRGYPHPLTITNITDITKVKESDVSFPLLIKPNITCGARGMTLIRDFAELQNKFPAIQSEYGDCHLQKYVRQGGAQVEVQLYVDENRKLVNSSVVYKYRWYPVKGGSSCCAKSVRNDKIVDTLYKLLLELNWVGFADFDTIEDPDTGELLIMELNPRVPACVKCPIAAGIRWGEIIVNGYLGLEQKNYGYKENEFLRHLGFEILWFIKSPNRFKTKPNWFRLFSKHVHYQDMSDWTDPLPFICGTWRNIKLLSKHEEKNKIVR